MLFVLAITWLFACQTPFGTDRHDLAGDRIVSVLVEPGDASFVARALVVSDGRPWQDEAVELSWAWVPEPSVALVDAVDPQAAEATGPEAVLPLPVDEDGHLALVATFPSGAEQRAVITVPALGPTPLPRPSRLALASVPLDATEATEDELARDARLALTPNPVEVLPTGRFSRFELTWSEGVPDNLAITRWSTVGGRGTFLELDVATTDWSPADLVLDDLQIDEATPIDPGVVTVLALALDDAAGTTWLATDAWLGDPAPGLTLSGRFFPTDAADPGTAWVRATLVAEDTAPTGLGLDDVAGLDTLPDQPDPYGTTTLPCTAPVSGAFDPAWLFDGRCTRTQVDGATVVLEVTP